MTTKAQNRLQYIDQIKVFLTCLVVVHHAGQAYGDTGGAWLTNDEPHLGSLSPFFFLYDGAIFLYFRVFYVAFVKS